MAISMGCARWRVAAVAAALMAAGCDAPPPTGADVLASAQELPQPRPGRYRTVSTLTAYELPGAAPQELDRMRERMRRVRPAEQEMCLSAEEAKAGFKPLLLAMRDEDCRFERFEADDGRMSATMACASAVGVRSVIELAGTAHEEGTTLRLAVDQRGAAIPGGQAEIGLTIESRRIGDC